MSHGLVHRWIRWVMGYESRVSSQMDQMGHGSWVTWVTGQFTDGSDGSWVTTCDPLSALSVVFSGSGALGFNSMSRQKATSLKTVYTVVISH